jgi:biotin operon repressor
MAIQHAVRERPKRKNRRTKHSSLRYPNGHGGAGWSLFSAQGRVLFHLAACADSPVAEIAEKLGLTERAVWGVVRDLRQRGMLILRKKGRRHHYAINLDAPLLHPTIRGVTLRPILGKVASKAKRERPENCD